MQRIENQNDSGTTVEVRNCVVKILSKNNFNLESYIQSDYELTFSDIKISKYFASHALIRNKIW